MSEAEQVRVTRRRVFYIPGYDPIHPRRYRELYRKEAAAQAGISGYTLKLSPKRKGGPYGWHVAAEIEGGAVEADIDVLVWSDIVRSSMAQGIPATYLQLVRTAWAYIGSGALFRLMRLRKGPIIAALYPVAMLLAQLLVALVGAALIGWILSFLVTWWLGALAGLAMVPLMLRWFRSQGQPAFRLLPDA